MIFKTVNYAIRIKNFIPAILALWLQPLPHLAAADSTRSAYALYLDFPVLDLPYLADAAKMRAAKQGAASALTRYVTSYESPSMEQALALTKNLHAVNYYGNNLLWESLIPHKSKGTTLLNRLGANLLAGGIDLVFTYYGVVFSPQWLHEEFHRNGLTIAHIPSYDETYNRFNGGFANGSVSAVRDEDLIRWKATTPQEMVRSFAAGIESEFLLMRNLQKDNFYGQARYPNVLLNILLTKHTIDYVNQFKKPGFDASIDSMNHYGREISYRDYVGWDFTAWVYDLHRPDEPYSARGTHPSGNGVDRAIKAARLSEEERSYLTKMGKRQYINYLSPFMVGINRIPLGKKGLFFNFAARHYLTAFGDDITLDVMLQKGNRNLLVALHGYGNRDICYPGIEIGLLPDLRASEMQQGNKFRVFPSVMAWMQPDQLRFDAQKARFGGLVRLDASWQINKSVNVYLNADTKTKGWVAGNPYLSSNTGFRAGLRATII